MINSATLKNLSNENEMIKKFILLSLCLISACTQPKKDNQDPNLSSLLLSAGRSSLSHTQIAAGLLEGIASIPYYSSTDLATINQGLVEAQAEVTLVDGTSFVDKPDNMKQATAFFQKVLKQHGVQKSHFYILTGIEESGGEYTLLAVVYRPIEAIKVIDKSDNQTIHLFSVDDIFFYAPFETDVNGKPLDTIIDWAALPIKSLQTQKAQAIFITLAANSVLNDKKMPEYWNIEKRWRHGGAYEIVKERFEDMNKRMGL